MLWKLCGRGGKMKDRELKKYLQQSLQQEVKQSIRLEETVKLCTEIMQEQGFA